MRRSLVELLVDPATQAPLELEADGDGEEVEEGLLRAGERTYPVSGSIPRFAGRADEGQEQTERSFAYKWERVDSYGSERWLEGLRRWFLERYGFDSMDDVRARFAAAGRVLDAGCGSGFSTSTWIAEGWSQGSAEWIGVDISTAVDVARKRLGAVDGTHFVQGDVLRLPFRPGTFGAIISEGVLHHTPSTRDAIHALAPLLEPGGELMFYVYRKKAPIREFTDDYVRELISDLPPEEAWEALRPLTRLGQALAELEVEVEVPEDVDVLGIKAGRYDVQRLVYWNVAKLFWNADLDFEENHHVNFDWYAPRYAHRQTEEEVRRWCEEARLDIRRFHAGDSGFTVRAVRP
jgi:arsenite methyltransferase